MRFFSTFLVFISLLIFGSTSSFSECISCISFNVSAPVVLIGPTFKNLSGPIPDSQFTVVPFPDHFVGYTAAGSTYMLNSTTLEGLNANNLNTKPVISAGTQGNFDECGTWIQGSHFIPSTNTVEAWYHGESGYCHGEAPPYKTLDAVGYAISKDGGKTFTKPNYPNNIVLSGQNTFLNNFAGDGDFSIVPLQDKNYMFYIDHTLGSSSVAIAGTNASGPGGWQKWYNGVFSQPGIGGLNTTIAPLLSGVGYNTTWGNFTGITYQNELGVGFQVALSSDGINWSIVNGPLIPTGSRWSDATSDFYGYAQYPSIIGPDGTKNWSDSFYLYYMAVRPRDTSANSNRFLLRSKVTVNVNQDPLIIPQTSTALERYFSPSIHKHWITSSMPIPLSGSWDFADEGKLGNVFTVGGNNLIELDECLVGTNGYFVSTTNNCEGQTKLRVAGFIYSSSFPNTHAIYRCFISTMNDHFVSVDPNCEGTKVEGLLGYVLN